MILKEMKEKVLRMIEEINSNSSVLTDDPDIAGKINSVINQIMFELCRIKKIPAYDSFEVQENDEIQLDEEYKDFYQLNKIEGVDFEIFDNLVIFKETGIARLFYYKYPKRITEDTDDTYKFKLTDDILEIMPYGVAADLLKSDVSNQYGQVYANRYNELKQSLDPRYNTGFIKIEGGIDV